MWGCIIEKWVPSIDPCISAAHVLSWIRASEYHITKSFSQRKSHRVSPDAYVIAAATAPILDLPNWDVERWFHATARAITQNAEIDAHSDFSGQIGHLIVDTPTCRRLGVVASLASSLSLSLSSTSFYLAAVSLCRDIESLNLIETFSVATGLLWCLIPSTTPRHSTQPKPVRLRVFSRSLATFFTPHAYFAVLTQSLSLSDRL